MIVMTVPVTTGGNSRMRLAKNGATRKVTIPAMMTAPKIALRPGTPPPSASPMLIIGETAAKVTPCRSGSRTPIFQNPMVWMIEAIPQVNRSALIRYPSCSGVRSIGVASRIGTMTAPA